MEVAVSDDLGLKLRKAGEENGKPGRTVIGISVGVLIVACAILVLQVVAMMGGNRSGRGLPADRLESLALKLEKQGLSGAAARAWEEYIEVAGPRAEKRARILYRIGMIHQEAGRYEEALDAYYRSESVAAVKDLQPEISRLVAECLESLGKYAALSSELERRTAVPGTEGPGAEVLAEIGDRKITRADLDTMIEAEVDAQLSQFAGGLNPEERAAQKEAALESIRKQGGYAQWLDRFIAEELLYRKAMEEKLQEDEGYRIIARNLDRKMLAQRLLDRTVSEQVSVTPEEMKAYYEANPSEFEKEGELQPFEGVQENIYMTIRSRKESEIQRRLLDELRERYDVVIHRSGLESE
jgi:tetratricopeptide (TPR) repeat protein